jgi:hypothetical protein
MAKRNRKRKYRSNVPRHGRATTYCGAPCDLDKGVVCEDCKEFRRVRQTGSATLNGGNA